MDDYVLEVPQGFLMSDEAAIDTENVGVKHHFATLRFIRKAVTPFQTGQSVTIPGVYVDREDKTTKTWIREGLKQWNGMKSGGKSFLNALVATKTTVNGSEYQIIKVLESWKKKDQNTGEYHFDWQNFQLPELRKLPHDAMATLESGKVIYVQFETLSTGRKWVQKAKNEGDEDREGINTYWGNFKVYPTLEALKAAEKEFFGQFNANGNNGAIAGGVDMSNFPEIWNNSQNPQKGVEDLYAQIRTVTGGKFADKAKELMLIGPNGQPVKRLGSDQPVNLGELFATAMDVPLTEDISGAFAHLYK